MRNLCSKRATDSLNPKDTAGKKPKRWNASLRRLISHPYNIERLLLSLEEPAQIQELREKLQKHGNPTSILDQILSDETAQESLQNYKSGIIQMKESQNSVFGGHFRFDAHLQAIQEDLVARDARCSRCNTTKPGNQIVLDKVFHCSQPDHPVNTDADGS